MSYHSSYYNNYNNSSDFSIWMIPGILSHIPQSLILCAVYFCGGFLATNYGFAGSTPSYVETIKAAEPITSATVAVWWGIEVLTRPEIMSLGAIVTGVLLSTLGNDRGASSETTAAAASADGPSLATITTASSSSLEETLWACTIVMISNLCFSFRGLHQKLLRATDEGSTHALDDLNLQYRMQQFGTWLLLPPVLFFNGPGLVSDLYDGWFHRGFIRNGVLLHYVLLATVNGCAFASYNLASTFILSRISVVHHAALNCIRRIFAIVVTSIAFEVPITALGAMGIAVSVFGFMSFTHFKVQKEAQPPPVTSLLPASAIPK